MNRLQKGKDPECLFAQKIFEQGHYAGRTRPTDTRQGTYATAPSGVMLASVNTNDPKQMAAMLRRAISKWNGMTSEERMLPQDPGQLKTAVNRPENRYPEDGLVLRVFSRDLPRDDAPADWRKNAWNQDFAWFKKDEARAFLPERIAKGMKAEVPAPLVHRLARLNFVDNVRGQTSPFGEKDVQTAALFTEVLSLANGVANVRITGETRTERIGNWSIAGFKDMNAPSAQKSSINLKLFGTAKYKSAEGRFISFEMVALGTRIGATQYNGRQDDLGPAPIGYFITQTGATAADRVAPSNFWAYGW